MVKKHSLIRLAAFLLLFATYSSYAADRKANWVFSIEPTLGHATIHENATARSVDSYGFIAAIRYRMISTELEILQGTSKNVSNTYSSKVEEDFARGRFGFRYSYALLPFLETFARVGVEGQRVGRTTTVTATGAEIRAPAAMYAYPFVGSGISVMFSQRVALNFTGSATVKDPDTKNDYTATVGIQVNHDLK